MKPISHASYRSESELRNPLIAGPRSVESKKYTLATGTLVMGAIVGIVLNDEPVAAAAAGNTGNGAFGAVTLGANAKAGVYRIVCIEPGANVGTFLVEDPDGVVIGKAVVAVAFAGPINFTIADGATDFIAGDSFTVTVSETSEVKLVTAAATDGSQRPRGIAAHDADATDDEADVMVHIHGDFDKSQVSVGAGLTVAGVEAQLRAIGIHLITVSA